MSLGYIIVGKKFTGKTTSALKIVDIYELPAHAYDVRKEEKYRKHKNVTRFWGDEDEWVDHLIEHDYKACCITFITDEAGDVFEHVTKNKRAKKAFRGGRFNGNIYIFIFHDLTEIPKYVLRFCNYLWIKKSDGEDDEIRKKYRSRPEIYEGWKYVNASTNPHCTIEIEL